MSVKLLYWLIVKFFVFWDDNFWGDTDFAKELLLELKKLNKRWAAQVTLERCKDEELLKLINMIKLIFCKEIHYE